MTKSSRQVEDRVPGAGNVRGVCGRECIPGRSVQVLMEGEADGGPEKVVKPQQATDVRDPRAERERQGEDRQSYKMTQSSREVEDRVQGVRKVWGVCGSECIPERWIQVVFK